jgi:hypothetical protein
LIVLLYQDLSCLNINDIKKYLVSGINDVFNKEYKYNKTLSIDCCNENCCNKEMVMRLIIVDVLMAFGIFFVYNFHRVKRNDRREMLIESAMGSAMRGGGNEGRNETRIDFCGYALQSFEIGATMSRCEPRI